MSHPDGQSYCTVSICFVFAKVVFRQYSFSLSFLKKPKPHLQIANAALGGKDGSGLLLLPMAYYSPK
jgi:hypothetical protein